MLNLKWRMTRIINIFFLIRIFLSVHVFFSPMLRSFNKEMFTLFVILFISFVFTMQISSSVFSITNFKKFTNTRSSAHNLYAPGSIITQNNNRIAPSSERAECDKTSDLTLTLIDGRHKCVCKYPKLFVYGKSGQCNVVAPRVCENAKLDMTSLNTPKCIGCPENTRSVMINGIPVCESDSFKNSTDGNIIKPGYVKLTDPLVDHEFAEILTADRKTFAKNPCSFDAVTGKYTEHGAYGVSSVGEYYCVNNTSRAVTVRADTDYLTGNGGKYSNGVVVISKYEADNVIIEWHGEHNYILGYRYNVSKLYKHIVDKFNLSKFDYVNIFNAVLPREANTVPYPFGNSNSFMELANSENPKPSKDNLLLHYVLVSGDRVPLVPCDKLGTPGADLDISSDAKYEHYLFDNKRDLLRTSGYAVCTVPGRINLKPNVNHSKFTGVTVINQNNIISAAWFGTDSQLETYKKIFFDK